MSPLSPQILPKGIRTDERKESSVLVGYGGTGRLPFGFDTAVISGAEQAIQVGQVNFVLIIINGRNRKYLLSRDKKFPFPEITAN
jgi:hypothetical protein